MHMFKLPFFFMPIDPLPAITVEQFRPIPPSPGFYQPTSRGSYHNTLALSHKGKYLTTKRSLFISEASSCLHLIQFNPITHLKLECFP